MSYNKTLADARDGWPEYLMVRDTGLADDMGGLGQRIFTTAGAGYVKQKYVRADLAECRTLADAQPGGRVRLGDGLPPLPKMQRFTNLYGETYAYSAEQMWDYARAALSAQPSPGGQGDGVSISDDDRAVLQRLQDALPTAGINGWAKGVDVLERLLRESLAARHPVETQLGYTLSDVHEAYSRGKRDAARQPVDENYEVWAQNAENVAAELTDERAIKALRFAARGIRSAARQPVVAVPQGCDACERTGIRQNDEGRNVFCPDCDLGRACADDTSHPVGRSFQAGVAEWMGQCFLPSLYSNMTERGDRLLEEVLELLQAHGYDKARVATLVDYVFGRPVGEPAQEVGGVMVTLAGYCWVAGLDMHAAGDAELARIGQPEVMAKIRAKQEAKNALHFDTPLPGNAGPNAQAVDMAPRPMDTAPTDGTLVRLLVDFISNATEDTAGPAWTIGSNNDGNVMADERVGWQFAGWCWTHDHFTEGEGTPVGWLPLVGEAAQAVDLGAVRKCADEAVEFINHGYGGHARRKIQELLTLIDSQAVGNGN